MINQDIFTKVKNQIALDRINGLNSCIISFGDIFVLQNILDETIDINNHLNIKNNYFDNLCSELSKLINEFITNHNKTESEINIAKYIDRLQEYLANNELEDNLSDEMLVNFFHRIRFFRDRILLIEVALDKHDFCNSCVNCDKSKGV